MARALLQKYQMYGKVGNTKEMGYSEHAGQLKTLSYQPKLKGTLSSAQESLRLLLISWVKNEAYLEA
jgi:hypothetical protein